MYVSEFLEFWLVTLAPLGQNWWQTALTLSLSSNVEIYLKYQSPGKLFRCVLVTSDVNSREEIVVCVLGRLRTLVCWKEIYLTISEKYEHLARTGLLESDKHTSAGFQVVWDIEMLNSNPERKDCGSCSGRRVGDRKYVQKCWIPIQRKRLWLLRKEGWGQVSLLTRVDLSALPRFLLIAQTVSQSRGRKKEGGL